MSAWKLWSLSVFLLLAVGCADSLRVNPTSIEFESEAAGEQSFDIVTDLEWSLGCTSEADWCSVVPASGRGEQTVTVRVSKNNGNADRHAFVVVTAGEFVQTVAVVQPHAGLDIEEFSPAQAGAGETVSILGKNFSTVPSENKVTLNGVDAVVLSSTETKLKISVPQNIRCTGFLRVNVAGNTATAQTPFMYLPRATVATFAGDTQGSAETEFNQPRAMALDGWGNFFVADWGNHRLQKVAQGALSYLYVGSTPGFAEGTESTARFYNPSGLAVDYWGNLYVADSSNHRIRKITPTGPGTVFVSTFAGSGVQGGADGTGGEAEFNFPSGLAIDADGTLYVADWGNHRIRTISPSGVVHTLAGSVQGHADGSRSHARFYNPRSIAIDAWGNLFVADYGNHRIRKITPEGLVSTFAGGIPGYADGLAGAAQFNSPSGIVIDTAHNLYVADTNNHRIRRITPWGAVHTLAGSGLVGVADGNGNTAHFNSPLDLAMDAHGNLYVADSNNHRIRHITLQ